jgi:hypothetical protein
MVKKYVPAIEHLADGFAVPVMTEKRFGYVKVEDYDTLAAEVERMRDAFLALSVARAERDQIAAENAALAARLAEARELLSTIVNDRVTHVEGPERWVRLYPEDEANIRALLAAMEVPR